MDDAIVTKTDLQHSVEQLRSEMRETTEQLRSEMRETTEQLRSEMRQTAEQLRSEFQHGFDELKESFRDSQTELLKAFYAFAESNQQRTSQLEVNSQAVIARLATVETRLLEVEKRLNIPPAA
jgi:hypothetical protein